MAAEIGVELLEHHQLREEQEARNMASLMGHITVYLWQCPRGCRQNGGRVVNCWKWGECGRWGYDGSAPAPRYDR